MAGIKFEFHAHFSEKTKNKLDKKWIQFHDVEKFLFGFEIMNKFSRPWITSETFEIVPQHVLSFCRNKLLSFKSCCNLSSNTALYAHIAQRVAALSQIKIGKCHSTPVRTVRTQIVSVFRVFHPTRSNNSMN